MTEEVAVPQRRPATLTIKQLAPVLGVSEWALYQSVRDGNPPVPVLRVGKRLLFALPKVADLLGVEPQVLADRLWLLDQGPTDGTESAGQFQPLNAVSTIPAEHSPSRRARR